MFFARTRLDVLVIAGAALIGPASPLPAQAVPGSPAEIAISFAPIVRQAAPSVVNIFASRIIEERPSLFSRDPFFDQFFRDFGPTTPRVQNSLGSGVIVSSAGLVVSNYHVVGMADEIRVVLNDRREFAAEVVLADRDNDLAVLRVLDPESLPALELRDSDGVEVGELVLAIGNPFGIGQTVSMGIVSGLARSGISVGDGRGYFLQTDAAINPGNSGGALVDLRGRLVGINTAILSPSGGSSGIGFAIPANLVRSVVEQAEAGAAVFQRPWAGATGQPVDAALAEGMDLPRPEGMVLVALHPESPLRAAGLLPGDVVLSIGGQPVNSPQEMLFRMMAAGVGNTAGITYFRAGNVASVQVPLRAAPEVPSREARRLRADLGLRGLTIARINPGVIAEYDLPLDAAGVVVTAVDGAAARSGLQAGDILLGINGRSVRSPDDVEAAAAERVRIWQFDLIRRGERLRLRSII